MAGKGRSEDAFRALFHLGPDKDSKNITGSSALQIFYLSNKPTVVGKLLDYKAKLDLESDSLKVLSEFGRHVSRSTEFMRMLAVKVIGHLHSEYCTTNAAALSGNPRVLYLLLEWGAKARRTIT